MKILLPLIGYALISSTAFAANPYQAISGLKYPNEMEEGSEPIATEAWTLPPGEATYPGYSELLPYFLRAPNQLSAGSCLYMSLTGIAEFWLSKQHPGLSRAPDGPLDLSERDLMNIAGLHENQNGVVDWRTDSAYLFNNAGSIALNSQYRFTKGWFSVNANGDYVPARENAPGATYTASYNWIDQRNLANKSKWVTLPKFERQILFADPAHDQWNVGVMPVDIIDRIKTALTTRHAPVHVIYNHFGYWHAVIIAGFDDGADTQNCSFVSRFREWGHSHPAELRQQAAATTDASRRAALNANAAKIEFTSRKFDNAYVAGGGCHPKGMFYVRDSIYSDIGGPIYDYDLSRTGDEAPYAKTIVLHEYDWIRYMANHATQIYLR